jgi:hypothetical protein
VRAPEALLGRAVTEKSYEARLAALVRMLGSDRNDEVIATRDALKRTLAARGVDLNDLGDAIEKLLTGGLEEAELQRVYDAAYQKGLEDAARQRFEADGVFGLRPDGSHDWEKIALFCQREGGRLKPQEKQFVDDMAGRMSWPGREPTEKQGAWLLAIFRKLGGKLK